MASYLIKKPAYVDGVYYEAAAYAPRVITLDDSVPPSRTWEPVDQAAVDALKSLGVTRELAQAPDDPVKQDDAVALSQIAKKSRPAAQ